MQPTVLQNHGMAAYSPPPMTVISNVPWVPPDASSDVNNAFAYAPPRKSEDSPAPASTSETKTKTNEARQAPPPQRRVRARPAPTWGYANRYYGFRPWF